MRSLNRDWVFIKLDHSIWPSTLKLWRVLIWQKCEIIEERGWMIRKSTENIFCQSTESRCYPIGQICFLFLPKQESYFRQCKLIGQFTESMSKQKIWKRLLSKEKKRIWIIFGHVSCRKNFLSSQKHPFLWKTLVLARAFKKSARFLLPVF